MPILSKQAIPSKAAVRGHPLHPMLVPFPIAFLVGALASDLAFRATANTFWAEASFWLLAAGIVTGVLAALLGLIDFLSRPAIRRLPAAWVHFLGNGAALALAMVNLALRYPDPVANVLPTGLALSAVVMLILLVTGWLGGELVYRHRVGVSLAPAANAPSVADTASANAEAERRRTGTL